MLLYKKNRYKKSKFEICSFHFSYVFLKLGEKELSFYLLMFSLKQINVSFMMLLFNVVFVMLFSNTALGSLVQPPFDEFQALVFIDGYSG